MPFLETRQLSCPKCDKLFVATIYRERVGKELGPAMATSCPDCGTAGGIPVEVPPPAHTR